MWLERVLLSLLLLVGVSSATSANADTPMKFTIEADPQERAIMKVVRNGIEDIFATGEITDGTAERFKDFVKANNIENAKVSFNSPGGSLFEGMKLGRAIRALGFYTTVGVYNPTFTEGASKAAICASACAYAFAGGTSRFLDGYTGRLGIHQFYAPDDVGVTGEDVQQVSGLLVAYLDEMGVDAKAFSLSTVAGRDGMIWLPPEDALTLRFANNGSELPTAEIRLSGMIPYLRVEQNHHDVTARVLFNCQAKQMSMMFGIVTDPTSSAMFAENQKRSYFEFDQQEFLVVTGKSGGKANGSVVWLSRDLRSEQLLQLLRASVVSGWIDGFGAVRYGASLDIPPVRGKIVEFAKQCYGIE